METYKLDRIYIFLSSALGYNRKAEKKYFYDRKEKVFFNLGFKEGRYFVWTNQIPLSGSNRRIVEGKISRLISGEAEIIEIIQPSTKFQNLLQEKPNSEEFEELVKELHQEVKSFLQRNSIDVYETFLIE